MILITCLCYCWRLLVLCRISAIRESKIEKLINGALCTLEYNLSTLFTIRLLQGKRKKFVTAQFVSILSQNKTRGAQNQSVYEIHEDLTATDNRQRESPIETPATAIRFTWYKKESAIPPLGGKNHSGNSQRTPWPLPRTDLPHLLAAPSSDARDSLSLHSGRPAL